MTPQLNLKNVKSFFQAHARVFYDNLIGLPLHIQEQIAYRHRLCKDDCFVEGECKYCGCDAYKKAFANSSCNDQERFPDLMDNKKWEKYKAWKKIDTNAG
jgi:hypothetical protein